MIHRRDKNLENNFSLSMNHLNVILFDKNQ